MTVPRDESRQEDGLTAPTSYRLAVAAGAGGFLVASVRAAFSVEYPAIAADLAWSTTEVTAAFSLAMLVYTAFVAGTGLLIDRFGVRRVMVTSACLFTVSLLGTSFVTSLPAFYTTWGLLAGLGLTGIGFVPLLKAFSATPGRMGAAFGIFAVGQGIATTLVTPGIQALVDTIGWRASHVVMAAVTLVFVAVIAWAAPPLRTHTPRFAREAIWCGLHDRAFWLLFAGAMAFGFWALVPTHQVAHLMLRGFSGATAASLAGLLGATTLISGLAFGRLSDRSPIGMIALAASLMVAGTLALAVADPDQPAILVLYVIASGLGRGIAVLAFAVTEGRVLPVAALGAMSGLLEIGFGLGQFSGPLFAAALRDSAGDFRPGLFSSAIALTLMAAFTLGALRLQPHREALPLGSPGLAPSSGSKP